MRFDIKIEIIVLSIKFTHDFIYESCTAKFVEQCCLFLFEKCSSVCLSFMHFLSILFIVDFALPR